MIEVRNVSKSFGSLRAVDNLSFTVAEGEKLVLLGTSGCGKTTTLKMLNRLTEADSGQILINGVSIRESPPEMLRRGIGYVIQQAGLFPHYTVFENIAMVPRLLGWPEDQIRERVINLLTVMGLPPEGFAAKRPAQLSGGQAQRVGLARAMAANPPVILMDEPFGALDGVTRSRLRDEFTGLREWQEKTIVLVTHDVTEAFLLADRIALMDRGTVQQIGVPEKLLLYPASDFVRKFFDHQRLQLTLMVKSLRELMSGLSWLPESGPEAPVVEASASLWEVLETLQGSGAQTVGIRDVEGIRYIHRRDLLAAAFDPA